MKKSITTINTDFPSVDSRLEYNSSRSLLDFDIAIFDPCFPHFETIHSSSGGYCVALDSSQRLVDSIEHWKQEISAAVKAGKTIFVISNERKIENFAIGTTSPRKGMTYYDTQPVDNYQSIPSPLNLRNAHGKLVSPRSSLFKPLFDLIGEIVEYRVIFQSGLSESGFIAKDGSALGGVAKIEDSSGCLVFLPFFDFEMMPEETNNGSKDWTEKAIQKSRAVVSQLLEIDRALRAEKSKEPTPNWALEIELPDRAAAIIESVGNLNAKIERLESDKVAVLNELDHLEQHKTLLYGTGKVLENAIAEALMLLGYQAEGFQDGDLEIDHVITSPDGVRMIGEAEGKENSAVAISKFRQLETNINEDFERDTVDEPAKGILFGNGFRLKSPCERENEFTDKCVKNAKRLGTALVKTSDLYPIVVHLLNHPSDDAFRTECRKAIEETSGDLVKFPVPGVVD